MAAEECSRWKSSCEQTDCCRYLLCASFANYTCMAIPIRKIIPDGKDTRPIGPGPYPPNVPKEEIPKKEIPTESPEN